MNKILIITIILIIIIIVCYNIITSETFSMNINWKINIPKQDNTLYKKTSTPSFSGDGECYYVLVYDNKKMKKIDNNFIWKKDKNVDLENNIIKILKRLNVEETYFPDFNSMYMYDIITDKEDYRNKMYIVKIEDKLYIIEDIY